MPRFRPTPPGVHDSPEWKAASALARTIHRTIRPVSGELEVPPSRPGDAPAVTFQAKAAELGAYLFPEECAEVVRDALAAGLWRVREGGVLIIPAFPPSFEAKRRALGLGAQGGESSAARMARKRVRDRVAGAAEGAAEDSGGDDPAKVAAAIAGAVGGKLGASPAQVRAMVEALTPTLAPLVSGETAARAVTPTVTVTADVTVTPGSKPPPPVAPRGPFRGPRGEEESGEDERHPVTDPVEPVEPKRTVAPLELGRQLRDELRAAGKVFVGAASDDELAGLGTLGAVDYAAEDFRRIARHWSADPKAPRKVFAYDKATREGAPVTLGLLLGKRDAATGTYAGKGLRAAHGAALAWEERAAPGPVKATAGPSPVETARAEWERWCQERASAGVTTVGFEAWLSQGDDRGRAEARAWKVKQRAAKPKGATG